MHISFRDDTFLSRKNSDDVNRTASNVTKLWQQHILGLVASRNAMIPREGPARTLLSNMMNPTVLWSSALIHAILLFYFIRNCNNTKLAPHSFSVQSQ